jgi:Na+/melibiose symporter and related transporters
VPWLERVGFGLGAMGADGVIGTMHGLLNPVFNMVLGMNPALISTLLFIQRLWDAVTDPLVGQYSDNFRSRWGRRRPLMAAGAPFMALLFALLWWVPRDAPDAWMFAHLVVVSLVFYVAHAFLNMPLVGLRIEATPDYHERTRLAAVIMVFGFVFQIVNQWVFPLTQLSFFGDTITGLRWVTGACAVFFLFAGLAPVFFCKERAYATVAGRQPRISMREAFRNVRENPPLLRIVTARFIGSFSYNLVGMLGLYMNTYYVFGGDIRRAAWVYGVLGSAYMVSAILGTALLYPFLARRLGKKRTLQIAAGVLMAGCLAKLVIYQPGHPWSQLIVLAANGASNAGIGLMSASMIADIADYNEWRTGRRNEAFLASIMNWCDKAGNSLGSLLCGFILVWIGFDAKLGAQSPLTLELMKYSYFLMPFVGAAIVLVLLRRYDLDEDKVYQIRDELEKRHAASASAAT